MSTSRKTPAADRHHGGPGSSHQDASRPDRSDQRSGPAPGSPTSDTRSHVSGGGGERDRHHRHSGAGHAPDRADRSH